MRLALVLGGDNRMRPARCARIANSFDCLDRRTSTRRASACREPQITVVVKARKSIVIA